MAAEKPVAPELEAPAPSTEIDEFKPAPEDLEVAGADDVFRAMDRADELLILDEIQGRALEVFVYSFNQPGKGNMTDLSVAGVNEAVRLLNERGGARIRIAPTPPIVEEFSEDGEAMVRVMVYAEDSRGGGSQGAWGTATEPKHIKKGKDLKFDKFAATKALNKAERNAKKKLIPEEIRQTIIAMAREESKVRVLKAAAAPLAEMPPPLTDKKAVELKNQIRASYNELKEVNRMLLPPARFNAMLTRSEHEHARLEELLAHMQGLVEKARKDDDATVESTATEEK